MLFFVDKLCTVRGLQAGRIRLGNKNNKKMYTKRQKMISNSKSNKIKLSKNKQGESKQSESKESESKQRKPANQPRKSIKQANQTSEANTQNKQRNKGKASRIKQSSNSKYIH